ncbi:MAG: transporter, partial [Pseudomonas sp.]|nr:transporter [Pseudomonas sp.]
MSAPLPPLSTPSKPAIAKMEASMALGSFAIGTGEFAIMGLMPD